MERWLQKNLHIIWLKKILLLVIALSALSFNLFAYAEGFEVSLNVPLGVAIGTPNKPLKDLGYKSGKGFDTGVEIQIGYYHKI